MGRGRSKKPKGYDAGGEKSENLMVQVGNVAAAQEDRSKSENGISGGLLSPELMAELGTQNGGEAVIDASTAGNSKKKADRSRKRQRERALDGETKQLAANLSKSKAKKLRQLDDKRRKDGRRAELYRQLESNKLAPGQLSLLQSSKSISQNQETMRSRLKQAVQRAAAGMLIPTAAVRELESHPEMVADIEEALALPVGGALAAVRKTAAAEDKKAVASTSTADNGEQKGTRGYGATTGKASKAGSTATKGAVTAAGNGGDGKVRKEVAGSGSGSGSGAATAGEARSLKAQAVGSARTKPSVSGIPTPAAGAKCGRAMMARRGPSFPPPVEVLTVRHRSDSSDSSSSSGSEIGDESNQKVVGKKKDHKAGTTTVPDESVSSINHAETTGEDGHIESVSKATAGDTDGKPAASSGADWAAKMMSSLARVPTVVSKKSPKWVASKTGKPGALSVESSAIDAADGVNQPSETGKQAVQESDGTGSGRDGDDGSATEAAVLYPALPKWVEGNAVAYHAVQTSLPIVSDTAPANMGNKGQKDSRPRRQLPRPERWVPVARPVELQAARMQLPVCGMEQEIMEAIHDNDAVILCGETGSGKSTQVPQFLYEAGYAAHGLIGVTQPRRVAAVSTAERVAVELQTACGRKGAVAYQIRYDGSGVGPKTRVKFMTDGVLMQEITSDLLLRKYSAVLLDEAHERNLNTDVLLGMLSRAIPLRKQLAEEEQRAWDMLSEESKKGAKAPLRPLKLVIMSATLRVTDFTENEALFPTPPPVISATSRQHPVTVHFNKRTELYDYFGETFNKVCKVHRRLPDGGILVFLTGKREILNMCDKLHGEFPPPQVHRTHAGRRIDGGNQDEGTADKGDSKATTTTAEGGKADEADKGQAAGVNADGVKKGKRKRSRTNSGSSSEPTGTEWASVLAESAESSAGGNLSGSKTVKEKPREMDRERLLYREADDDEEDAALLADMEEANTADGGSKENEAKTKEGERAQETNVKNNVRTGAGVGDGGLSSDSEEEDTDNNVGVGNPHDTDAALQSLPPVHVVPLYAMLTAGEQAKVFASPPEGHRLIVVATNVAETSLTIPGISYVVDCGRQKRRVVQRGSGISQFEVGWVSRASADQRAGRAGRTGPGHCYRLYSSALYSQTLEPFAPPEVLTRPLEDVMLQMKAMGVVDVSRFPFPTPPDAAGLRAAATLLSNLGATAAQAEREKGGASSRSDDSGEITAVGKALALLPIGARYAKMLLLAVQGGVLSHAIAMVAMLTEGDPFVKPEKLKEDEEPVHGDGHGEGAGDEVDTDEVRRRRAQWLHPTSDALARLKAAGAYAHVTSAGTTTGGAAFCCENFLHPPTMERSLQLRHQLARLVNLRFGSEPGWRDCDVTATLKPPSRRQSDALRQVLLSGLLDNVARKAPAGTVQSGTKLQRSCAFLSCNAAITEPLYIKSNSVLFSRDPQELPEYVAYQDIVRGEREGAHANMTCVSAIEPSWLPALAEGCPLLSFSEPLASPPPTYDSGRDVVICRVTPRYGVHSWDLPVHCADLANAAMAQDASRSSSKNSRKSDLVFRWFARLLLEGAVGVLPGLKSEGLLNDPPSLLTRDGMPTKKATLLVLELRQKGVCSLPALAEQWRRDRSYLKLAVQMWVKLGDQRTFETVWDKATKAVVAVTALVVDSRPASGAGQLSNGKRPVSSVGAENRSVVAARKVEKNFGNTKDRRRQKRRKP